MSVYIGSVLGLTSKSKGGYRYKPGEPCAAGGDLEALVEAGARHEELEDVGAGSKAPRNL